MDLNLLQSRAIELMQQYGLISATRDWGFTFDNAIHRFGQCSYRHRRISISRKMALVNTEAECIDTVLHEIAHALTPGHSHDSTWMAKAVELGARPKKTCDETTTVGVESKWTGECMDCKVTWKRHRLTESIRDGFHRKCNQKEHHGHVRWFYTDEYKRIKQSRDEARLVELRWSVIRQVNAQTNSQ